MTPADTARRRALHLFRSARFDLAEPELRRALALDPEDPELHWLLSLTLSNLGRLGEGLEEADAAVALGPEVSGGHYARATALLDLGRRVEGTDAAIEAVRLDPENAVVRVKLATAWYVRHDLRQALEETDRALALDPESASATNLRATILGRQGRHREAAALVEDALALEPDNPWFHADRGWALLHLGREREAMVAFRESLRLKPGFERARSGILEAMKARNVVYRWLLRFDLWKGRMPPLRRWTLFLGGFVLAMVYAPVFGLYFGLLLIGWIGRPLYNIVLLMDPFGRAVLTRGETIGAVAVAGCLWSGLVVGALGLGADDTAVALAGGVLASMSIPVSATAQAGAEFGRRPTRLLVATAVLAVVGVAFVVATAAGEGAATAFGGCYVVGLVLSVLVLNALKH
ncbi:tetratricopeptide repeat protein [Rubrivirga sp.]|uniref:tetratricopeptide repeat protein n=1 Tax=Rubrivirga sp. TaxID=1885344 RepID=UPI003B5268AF